MPNKALASEAIDRWAAAVKTTPEQIAQQEEDLQRRDVEIAHREELFKAETAALKGVLTLTRAAATGDADAGERLLSLALLALCFVAVTEKTHPDMVRSVARKQTCWPVLASDEPGWEKEAAKRVGALDLGADMRFLRVRFRQARGTDANLPARRWAKAAVRTIEETRLRWLAFGHLLREFGSCEALAGFHLEAGWEMSKDPAYMQELAHLDAFAETSLPGWKRVVRKMIRQAMPEFHTRPEWTTQRNTAAASGRDTPGEIQHAILDDIVSALERLAPV